MEEECTWVLLNNTFSALNYREALQLQVKVIGSKWVYKTRHNADRSTCYNARLVIKGYEQTDVTVAHDQSQVMAILYSRLATSLRSLAIILPIHPHLRSLASKIATVSYNYHM